MTGRKTALQLNVAICLSSGKGEGCRGMCATSRVMPCPSPLPASSWLDQETKVTTSLGWSNRLEGGWVPDTMKSPHQPSMPGQLAPWEKNKFLSCVSFYHFGFLLEQLNPHPSQFRSPRSTGAVQCVGFCGGRYTHICFLHLLQQKARASAPLKDRMDMTMEALAAHSEQKLQRLELNTLVVPTHLPHQPWLWTGGQELLRGPCAWGQALARDPASGIRHVPRPKGAKVQAFKLILE